MSYRQSYIRRGLSPESRLAMEAADEGSLDENLHSNVLRDSINYEGMVAPHRVSQQTPNANANPAPGNGAAVMRVRLQGRLDIYPDESDLTGQDSQYIRKDLDNFYLRHVLHSMSNSHASLHIFPRSSVLAPRQATTGYFKNTVLSFVKQTF